MRNLIILVFSTLLISSCASVGSQYTVGVSNEATETSYNQNKDKLGVVLLDARWGRQWKCGRYENAQLVSFSFDKFPLTKKSDELQSDITVATTSILNVSPKFQSYALLVPPGEYGLSNFTIKVASSSTEVAYWVAKRSELIKDRKPLGGKFRVSPGEVIYIGNFALDCFGAPQLWRYYADGQEGFNQQLADYSKKYPFLDLSKVEFRLFETEKLGRSYHLK